MAAEDTNDKILGVFTRALEEYADANISELTRQERLALCDWAYKRFLRLCHPHKKLRNLIREALGLALMLKESHIRRSEVQFGISDIAKQLQAGLKLHARTDEAKQEGGDPEYSCVSDRLTHYANRLQDIIDNWDPDEFLRFLNDPGSK